MPEKSLQEYLFQRIKEVLTPGITLVDAVADALHLSIDSAYRRIRGETPLILEEAKELCSQYKISLDDLLKANENAASFQVMRVNTAEQSFENYWTGLLQALQWIASFKDKQIIYLTKDMPFFYNFTYRPLFAFRHFFWMKSILQHPDFLHRQFSFDCLTPAIEKLGLQILQVYNTIPSTEIWNTESINSTVSQIEYYREAGYFSGKDDAAILFETLEQLIRHLQQQAAYGCKFLPAENPDVKQYNFKLFYNRVVLGDNTILVTHDDAKTLYLNFDVLNYMYTRDERLCHEVYGKMQNLMRRATLLSQASEKQRYFFFNTLLNKIPRG